MMRNRAGKVVGVIVAALALTAGVASAQQAWPVKPVRVVVPYSAGGVTDIMARVISDQLSQSFKQQFVVENRAGAGGAIGMEAVIRGPHDGYTLVMMPANLAIMPALYEKLSFQPLKDVVPIVNVGSSPTGIGVHPSLGIKTFAELIAYAKANPGKLNYASCGAASPQHLAAEYLSSVAGVQLTHILYKGCGQAIPDVLAGTVPLFFASIPHLIPHHKSGKLRAVAVTGRTRSDLMPEVPTVIEAGYKDFDVVGWFGLLAPRDTPRDIVLKVNAEVNRLLGTPAVQEKMAQQYFTPVGGSPESFGQVIQADADRLGKIVREAKIRAD